MILESLSQLKTYLNYDGRNTWWKGWCWGYLYRSVGENINIGGGDVCCQALHCGISSNAVNIQRLNLAHKALKSRKQTCGWGKNTPFPWCCLIGNNVCFVLDLSQSWLCIVKRIQGGLQITGTGLTFVDKDKRWIFILFTTLKFFLTEIQIFLNQLIFLFGWKEWILAQIS